MKTDRRTAGSTFDSTREVSMQYRLYYTRIYPNGETHLAAFDFYVSSDLEADIHVREIVLPHLVQRFTHSNCGTPRIIAEKLIKFAEEMVVDYRTSPAAV